MSLLDRVMCICFMTALAHPGQAQTYPNKSIRLIVTFAAGGGADFMGRLIGQKLGEGYRQTVVVDNRAGAGGAIGNEVVARAPPDGYTLLLGAAGPLVIAPALYQKLLYDTVRDYAPITLLASAAFALTTHPSVPATSVKELLALARANPGKLNYGSSGTGGAPHLAGELFQTMAKVKLVHVTYKGLSPAIIDLIGGQLDLIFADLNLVGPHFESGRLRGIAVTSAKRSSLIPGLPTVAEAGIGSYQAGTWYGVLAPAATPRDIVVKLNADINRILGNNDVRERLATQGAEGTQMTPEQFAAFIRSELEKWARLVKSANIRLE